MRGVPGVPGVPGEVGLACLKWSGSIRFSMVWYHLYGMFWCAILAWHGMVRCDLQMWRIVWYGMVWYFMVQGA